MKHFAACALVVGLALVGAAVASSGVRARGPFVPDGAFQGGASSGFSGDRSSARTGDELGCLSRRHYSFAITVRNRSGSAATLTGASGPNPNPHVVARVAMQVRHLPPPQPGDAPQPPLIKHWSAAPARPVTIEPGRSAVVQSNFLLRHCAALAHGRKVVVPGSLVLRYRVSGHAGKQRVVEKGAGFSVIAGPIIRSCARVPGSVSLLSYNIGCVAARAAAPTCHHMSHPAWGSCRADGRKWDCDLHSSWVQDCFFPDRTSRWYRVRWAK
jgi:hypothetical protein